MDEPELAELANDITANGLRLSLTFWRPSADSDSGNGDGKTPTGDIIKPGWRYKDGASAGAPLHQYCYYSNCTGVQATACVGGAPGLSR